MIDLMKQNHDKIITVIKERVLEFNEKHSTEQILQVASLVKTDPMTDCLISQDKKSWTTIVNLFEEQAQESDDDQFMRGSQAYMEDKIVKGK